MKPITASILIMSLTASVAMAQTDVHCHMIPDSYMEAVKAHGMEMDEGFPIPSWSIGEHLGFMDEAGIRTAVLTMPAPQPYFGDGVESAAVCRRFNEEAAALKALHPGRFLFCAALPLPDVDRALEEAEYALEVLGADGVKLASNSDGQYLGDPELDPLMAYLNGRKAVIITHPHKPSAVNEKLIAAIPLASYEYLARLYFDLAGAATDDAIESLLTITEPSHILYGSDYPYVAAPALISAKKSLESRLAAHGLDPKDIFTDNAARLFGADIPVRAYGERIVRLAEIVVDPKRLDDYLAFAKEVGTVSMATEPGVIGLFSMQDKENPSKIYILEVYADRLAYEAHIRTAHFRKYKEGTADMVQSLRLIDTAPLLSAKLDKTAIQ